MISDRFCRVIRPGKAPHTLSFALLALALIFVCSSLFAQPAISSASKPGWIEFRNFRYEGRDPLALGLTPLDHAYTNPILSGFYPDPSIVRVREDYYLVNSSFAWFPGVPIFHSRDLIHWTQLGHVLDRPSQLSLDGVGVSDGIYAPSIRYHDGVFYLITTDVSGMGNFYVTASNPSGPWSDPVLLPQLTGIDPSLFFDEDGKAYIVANSLPPEKKETYAGHRAIWLYPFDTVTGKINGPGKVLVNGGTNIAQKPVWIEGPHLFKREGYYYLIAAEGGTGDWHSEVVFRSRQITGPYESFPGNPILTQRTLPGSRPHPISTTGHADFVETQAGEWWAVFLGCEPYRDGFYNTGRETFALPVNWVNGWPVVLRSDQSVPRIAPAPALPAGAAPPLPTSGNFSWTDDFREKTLPPVYNFLRTPRENWWSLTDKPGSLLLKARGEDLNTIHNPSLIARRQQHAEFSASVELVFHQQDGPCGAGIVAFQNETHSYFLGVRNTIPASKTPQTRTLFLEKRDGRVAEVASLQLPANAKMATLRIEGDGSTYRFSYRLAEGSWQSLGGEQDGTILSTKTAGGFVGTYLGMFARSRN